MCGTLAPAGPEAADWRDALEGALGSLAARGERSAVDSLGRLLAFEMRVLELSGLSPDLSENAHNRAFQLRGERRMPVSRETLGCLRSPRDEKNLKILVDAARAIGVFYAFHLDCASDVRRTVLRMICNNERRTEKR